MTSRNLFVFFLVFACFLASGCGRAAKKTSHTASDAASTHAPGPPTPAGREQAARGESQASSRPLPRTGRSLDPGGAADAEESASEAAPWRRPGLATRWGEERESRIRETHFHRQYSEPSAVVSVYYDDEQGIHAATGLGERFAYEGVFPVRGGALTVAIVDDDGDPLPAIQTGGRRYVLGDEGDRYQIRVQNHTPGRFEIVASVDGLDVIDGQDGTYGKRGYVVSPWSTLTIEGFRDSYDSVRAFRFGSVEESYAARRGKGQNIGVIGVALFEEEGFHWRSDPARHQADPFPGRFAPPPGW